MKGGIVMYQILVADDDESIVVVVTAALEREGYSVTAAQNNGYIKSESEDLPILIYRKNSSEN